MLGWSSDPREGTAARREDACKVESCDAHISESGCFVFCLIEVMLAASVEEKDQRGVLVTTKGGGVSQSDVKRALQASCSCLSPALQTLQCHFQSDVLIIQGLQGSDSLPQCRPCERWPSLGHVAKSFFCLWCILFAEYSGTVLPPLQQARNREGR